MALPKCHPVPIAAAIVYSLIVCQRFPCRRAEPAADLARCFLRLANLPNLTLDRLSRYEAILWRQVSKILFALHALDHRKRQDRGRRLASVAGQNCLLMTRWLLSCVASTTCAADARIGQTCDRDIMFDEN
jgi:hypothetical protein